MIIKKLNHESIYGKSVAYVKKQLENRDKGKTCGYKSMIRRAFMHGYISALNDNNIKHQGGGQDVDEGIDQSNKKDGQKVT